MRAQSGAYGEAGYVAAAKNFRNDIPDNLAGHHFMVTGANSGLGYETCRALLSRRASVHMLCRNQQRGEEARQKLLAETAATARPEELVLHVVDVGHLASVRRFAADWQAQYPRLDALVHNAGGMSTKREETTEGHETTLATHVLGPHLLTQCMEPAIRRSRTRVVWVASGGMYTQRLDLADPESKEGKFDGTATYAQVWIRCMHALRARALVRRFRAGPAILR